MGRNEGAIIRRTRLPPWVSAVCGAAILVLLGFQLGTRPFVEALRGINGAAIVAAIAITAGTTWCCARRWSLIAHRMDVGISVADAFRACYRAQFINVTLPTGVVGDVDRAVWHGHSQQAMARGVRSVVWDRVVGQAVLLGLVLVALPALLWPSHRWAWGLAGIATIVVVAHVLRPLPRISAEVVALSTLAVLGHLAVFLIACHTVDVTADLSMLVPLGLVFLQISAIPLSVAGWGPREGGAALIFGVAGLGADTGLAVSVAYGVLSTLAVVPGVLAMKRGAPSWANVPTPS